MSDRPQRSTAEAAWLAQPGRRRVLVAGWGLFALIDLLTRLRVHDDPAVAIGLSLALDPLIFLLAAALHAAFGRLGFEGRITRAALPWIIGLSLAASAVVVVAGLLLRDTLGIGLFGWARQDAATLTLVHYFMVFLVWSVICFWMKAEGARQAEARRAIQAEAQALRIELQRLRLQLDPHFLFNALNGIGEEIPEHPQAALAMLADLSTFLRQSLNGMGEPIATVGAEAEAIASYLRVQEARFGPRLAARLDVDAAATARSIPNFLLQPLVENAIKHGRRDPFLELGIAIHARGDALRVVIRNTGALAVPGEGSDGIGLANVRRRLALHYPGCHAFTLSQQDAAVVAELVLDGAPCAGP